MGSSRSVRGSFRGGRSNFRQPPLRPPSRGRGKGRFGRGGSRRNDQSVPDRKIPDTQAASVGEPSIVVQEPVMVNKDASVSEPAPKLTPHPVLPVAWCDICRVGCNSLEILEQHKNGKRHKKTVQRIQEIEAQQKLMAEFTEKSGKSLENTESKVLIMYGTKPSPCYESKPSENPCGQVSCAGEVTAALSETMKHSSCSGDASEVNRIPIAAETIITEVNKGNESSILSEILPLEKTEHKVTFVAPSQNLEGKTESLIEKGAVVSDALEVVGTSKLKNKKRVRMDDRRLNSKTMRGGRGKKRLRYFEQVRIKAPERPREQPRVCTLCNVTCDTLAVFDCHLTGKKHISHMKRFQGQNSVFGPISVFIPPNQLVSQSNNAPEAVYYGLKSHEMMIQQETYVMNAFPIETCGFQQRGQTNWHMEAQGLALNPQSQQGLAVHSNEIFTSAAQCAPDQPTEIHYNSSGCEENAVSRLQVLLSPAKTIDGAASARVEDVTPTSENGVIMVGLNHEIEPSTKND